MKLDTFNVAKEIVSNLEKYETIKNTIKEYNYNGVNVNLRLGDSSAYLKLPKDIIECITQKCDENILKFTQQLEDL